MTQPRHEGHVVVRVATGNDLDQISAVGCRTWLATYDGIVDHDLVELFLAKKWTKEALISSVRSGRTLVAEVDSRIVGMAAYGHQGGALVLWRLYVLPEYQRAGIGARLLQAVMTEAEEAGRDLEVSFTDGNPAAWRFVHAHGFTQERREQQGIMPDLVWLSRPNAPAHGRGRS